MKKRKEKEEEAERTAAQDAAKDKTDIKFMDVLFEESKDLWFIILYICFAAKA